MTTKLYENFAQFLKGVAKNAQRPNFDINTLFDTLKHLHQTTFETLKYLKLRVYVKIG